MIEWNKLLDYIDNYIYVTDKEEISIVYNEQASEADQVYQYFLKEVGEQKWEFDIALDCIRQMNEESRKFLLAHMDYTEHHFGLGMFIRNHYIHSSNKHGNFEADSESSVVFGIILTILHPYYDFRNKLLVSIIEDYDFGRIEKLYREDFGNVIDEKLMGIAKETGEKNCEEVLEELRGELRDLSGKDFFKQKFVKTVQELRQKGKLSGENSNLAFKNAVYNISVLYPLEYQQLAMLFTTNLRKNITEGVIKNIEECEQYIDQNIGFKKEYTDFLAQCFFEAFQE